MMLFALSDGNLTPDEIEHYFAGRDLEDDDEIDAFTWWLRQFRPRDP